jgi:hypothetical protein
MSSSENSVSTTLAVAASFVIAAAVGTSLIRIFDDVQPHHSEDSTGPLHKLSRFTDSDQEDTDQMTRSAWSRRLKNSWQDDSRRLDPIAPRDKHPHPSSTQEHDSHTQRPG